MSSPARHAIVIGASMSGMCVARVLADHVDRVTIVERDRLSDEAVVRAGVPQAHHLHVLITAGQHALDELFPGVIDELYATGAVRVAPTDSLYLTASGWRERFPTITHQLVGGSRELIDWTVRQRLLANPRIEFLAGHEVVGLVPAPDGPAVAGVRLRPRGGGADHELAADVVVDASGRGSRTPDWLDELGYPRPEEVRIDAGLGYASRRYALPDDPARDWKTITIMPDPPRNLTGAVLFPIERNRWMLTLGGIGEFRPPTDEEGFLEFVRSLRSPVIAEAIADAQPDSPIHGFRQTSNRRRHYESMARFPDGLLVVGDAACCFNPVYGQGMAVAAQTALALSTHLRRRAGSSPVLVDRTAQALAARIAATAWLIATGADRRVIASVDAAFSLRERLMQRYLDRANEVANRDPYVCQALTDVLYLVRPPSALMHPGVLARVVRGPRPRLLEPPARTAVSQH